MQTSVRLSADEQAALRMAAVITHDQEHEPSTRQVQAILSQAVRTMVEVMQSSVRLTAGGGQLLRAAADLTNERFNGTGASSSTWLNAHNRPLNTYTYVHFRVHYCSLVNNGANLTTIPPPMTHGPP